MEYPTRWERLYRLLKKVGGITAADQLVSLNENINELKAKVSEESGRVNSYSRITSENNEIFFREIIRILRSEEKEFLAPALCNKSSLDLYPKDLSEIDHFEAKIVIFGLQKAGNTWLLALLSDALGWPAFFNIHDPQQIGRQAVVSTHDPLNESIWSRSDFLYGVCLVRDMRDIILSYHHYMQTDSFQRDVPKAKYPDIHSFYYEWFLSRMAVAHRYETYWDEYASHGVPVLRYERLIADTGGELRRLFARWGLQYDQVRLDDAVEQNRFSNLKKGGRKIGQVKIESSHFRKGKAGTFREELPNDILQDINQRFGNTLRRWGYEV